VGIQCDPTTTITGFGYGEFRGNTASGGNVAGITSFFYSGKFDEPYPTGTTPVGRIFEDIISNGYTADGRPIYMIRQWESGSPENHALYNVYSGISSGHSVDGTTSGYMLNVVHYSSNFASGNNFGDASSIVTSFIPLPLRDELDVPDGGGDNTGNAIFNYRWLYNVNEDMSAVNDPQFPDPDEDFFAMGTNANRRERGLAWGLNSDTNQAGLTGGGGGLQNPAYYDPPSDAVYCMSPWEARYAHHSFFRIHRFDMDGNDLAAILTGDWATQNPNLSAVAPDTTMRISHYSDAGVQPEGQNMTTPGMPHFASVDSYVQFQGITVDYVGLNVGSNGGTGELGITVGTMTSTFYPIGKDQHGYTINRTSCDGTVADGLTFVNINEWWSHMFTVAANPPDTAFPGSGPTRSLELPVKIIFSGDSLYTTRSARTMGSGVIKSDGTITSADAKLENLSDVSSSITSQVSEAQTNVKGDVRNSLGLLWNSETEAFGAVESGIQTRVTVPFRIESDVPIVAGDEKILRTIPFEAEIDSCTLFIPEGIASGAVVMGLDKYDPGASYPTAAAKTDMIGTLPTNNFSVTTSGNTYYSGLTYGDMRNAAATWDDPGLSAGSILSINVNTNTANVNTIIGDIVLKRIS
jgi:hypothetical protein